jgi:septal ring factor EnvC (AmiA/AmiB activator)
MSTITDTDLQQLKDLITAGNATTQKQISELTLSTQKQISDLKEEMRLGFAQVDTKFAQVGTQFAHLEGKIDTINAELTIIKSNQKAQDARFWTLIFLIITTSIGVIGKLAKFY